MWAGEELVDAARALFLDRGYGATTIEAISARSEVPPATVYRLFSSWHGAGGFGGALVTVAQMVAPPGTRADGEMLAARGRGRPAATDSRDTRARILDAALRLFGNGSYEAVSMVAVGTESGVDKRTVRYHFGSKRELFEAARAEAFRRFADDARVHVLSRDTARDRLQAWVDVYRRLHAFDTDVLRFLGLAVAEGITEPARQDSLVEAGTELFGMLAEVIEAGVAAGELNPSLDVAAAVQLVSAISIGLSLMSMSPGPFPGTLDALDLVLAGDFFVEPPAGRQRGG